MFHTFRFRLTFLVGILTLAVMATLFVSLGTTVASVQERDQGDALHVIAQRTSSTLSVALDERMRDIDLMAATPRATRPDIESPLWRVIAQQLQHDRPELSWIGVVGTDGIVRSATGGLLTGVDVSERPWFGAALSGSFVGDVHPAALLESLLPPSESGDPLRFVDFAAPLHGPGGDVVGVLGAHGDFQWIADLVSASHTDRARDRGAETFIVNAAGEVIHHPPWYDEAPLLDQALTADDPARASWSDGEYLTVAAPLAPSASTADLGWTIVTRQPIDAALTGAAEARRAVLIAAAAAVLVLTTLVWVAVGRFSRPLEALSTSARRIEAGELDERIDGIGRSSELRQLSSALRGMTATLVERELELEATNTNLEQRVAERTEELEHANAELDRLARHDGLTGLLNRRAGDQRLDEEFDRHRRRGATMSIAIMDVDHFKRINDTFSHPAGDAVLREVSDALRGACRSADVISRHGGEEFLIVLPETEPEAAHIVAERIRREVAERPMPVDGLDVTLSVGLVTSAELFDDADAALSAADRALYRAKQGGRNRVVTDDALAVELAAPPFAPSHASHALR